MMVVQKTAPLFIEDKAVCLYGIVDGDSFLIIMLLIFQSFFEKRKTGECWLSPLKHIVYCAVCI